MSGENPTIDSQERKIALTQWKIGDRFSKGLLSENNLLLDQFPSLFAMEAQTGFCGSGFTFIWMYFAGRQIPTLWPSFAGIIGAVIILAFLLLAGLSLFLGDNFGTRIHELNAPKDSVPEKAIAHRVRVWMTSLSTLYVLVFCLLIWLTGGVTSPFIPFYVLIFALTITKIRVPIPGIIVLVYFLVAFLSACAAAKFLPPIIAPADMANIQYSGLQTWMYVLFTCASLLVPTISTFFVQTAEIGKPKSSGGAQ